MQWQADEVRRIDIEARTQTICSCLMCHHPRRPTFEKINPMEIFL
jgi:hypothetical protein